MKQIFIILTLLIVPNYTFAWDFSECLVAEVILGDDDRNAHVQLDCSISNVPSCAVANRYFAIDRSTESGKQKLALVMTAQASGMKVTGNIVQGENSCPVWQGNVALLAHLRVKK